MGYFVEVDGVIRRAVWVNPGRGMCDWEGDEGDEGDEDDEGVEGDEGDKGVEGDEGDVENGEDLEDGEGGDGHNGNGTSKGKGNENRVTGETAGVKRDF